MKKQYDFIILHLLSNEKKYDIQINIILFIPEFCKKSIFTKNRISPKNECIFPENPRNFSLHRQKTALFFGKCSVFSLFPKKYRFPSINLTEKNYLCSRRTKYIVQGQ